MSYVDAHLHLADPGFAGRVEQAIADADKNNVTRLLSNAMDYASSLQTIALAERYRGKVFAAIGVHPWTATNETSYELDKFEQLLEQHKDCVKAIGEIGLDGKYSQDEKAKTRQMHVFRFFLELAERRKLPVVVHSRQAVNEVLETLSNFNIPKVLLHWYDGPTEKLKSIQKPGYLISIGPAVFTSVRISEIARATTLDMILTETDGPVRYRGSFEGRPTQPSFVLDVVQKLAEIKTLSVATVRETVWNNFQKFMPGD